MAVESAMKLYYLKIIFGVVCLLSINTFAGSRERDLEPWSIRREIDRLKEIRDNDPAKYEHELREYQQSLRAKMQKLQKNNPEKYKEIQSKILRQKHSLLKENFEKHPSKRVKTYEAYTNRLHSKLLFLQENDPDSYEKLKARISQEREKRFKGNGQGPPPNPLFDQMPRGRHEAPRNSDKMHRKDMQRKLSEIEAKIDQLPPEQREEAKARLEQKLAEKRENFKKLEFNKDSRDGSKESLENGKKPR